MDLHVLRFRLRALGTLTFDAFPGITLRGALGQALREMTCAYARRNQCPGCPQPEGCAYARLFRPTAAMYRLPVTRYRDLPPPLTLRPRFGPGSYGAGSVLEFEMTVVGAAWRHVPAIVAATAALERAGLGQGRDDSSPAGSCRLDSVDLLGPGGFTARLFDGETGALRPVSQPWRFPDDFLSASDATGAATSAGADAAAGGSEIQIDFRSPTLFARGRDPRGEPTFGALIDMLLRRYWLLSSICGGDPVSRDEQKALVASAESVLERDRALSWVEWPHRSTRQRRTIPLGGWTGRLVVAADADLWLPYLRLASLLHVGKHTLYGFGEVMPAVVA